ncbi:MAG TPA: hypothetical protein VG276_03965 [Actinomycetes bacterium]|nr:hypothetical protein [Actinomycetes bacterium]
MTAALSFEDLPAPDLFLLRQIAPGRLFNVDGRGRGAGWAGNVTVDASAEPLLARVTAGTVLRRRSGVPFRAFGPYWTTEVAVVGIGGDMAVLGGTGAAGPDDERLLALAGAALGAAGAVPAEKVVADELEAAQAAAAASRIPRESVAGAARALAGLTSRALSCGFGAVLLVEPQLHLAVADEGWHPAASATEVITAMLPLAPAAAGGLLVEQDLRASPFPYRPLSFADGLVARCTAPLRPQGGSGLLLVAHAGGAPRGFTSLCQRVMAAVAKAGGDALAEALAREQGQVL